MLLHVTVFLSLFLLTTCQNIATLQPPYEQQAMGSAQQAPPEPQPEVVDNKEYEGPFTLSPYQIPVELVPPTDLKSPLGYVQIESEGIDDEKDKPQEEMSPEERALRNEKIIEETGTGPDEVIEDNDGDDVFYRDAPVLAAAASNDSKQNPMSPMPPDATPPESTTHYLEDTDYTKPILSTHSAFPGKQRKGDVILYVILAILVAVDLVLLIALIVVHCQKRRRNQQWEQSVSGSSSGTGWRYGGSTPPNSFATPSSGSGVAAGGSGGSGGFATPAGTPAPSRTGSLPSASSGSYRTALESAPATA